MPNRLRFGRFEVLTIERQLLDAGRPVALGARAFDLLHALIERRDRLVGKAELLDVVWPGLVVEEANLPVQISTLRRLIGPQAIATIPGLGYRFAMTLDTDGIAASPQLDIAHAPQQTNVPTATDLLLDREAELDELTRWLAAHRTVTVLGAGGVGKTRLAQAVARELAGTFLHGAWWVDLSALSSTDKIASAIANAVNLPLDDGDALATLVNLIAPREVLLVLDNCEHLAGGVAAVVAGLLSGTERLRVLATSQVALKIAGEHLYPLGPLAVAPAGTPVTAAREFGALRLLEQRAQAVDPRFALTEENVEQAIDLCRHLDGIPLAIEMAAVRVPALGLRGLHDRLGARLNLLQGSVRDLPTRQQTLRATLDWSHALLASDEQAVLRRLAVFGGSFGLDVALHVAMGADLDEWQVVDALGGLVEKSLVKLERLEPPRYRLFDTMRLYARERLTDAGESDGALRRHGTAMAKLAEEAEHSDLAEAAWLDRFGPDYDDLPQAFDLACDRLDADCAATIVGAMRLHDRVGGTLTHSRGLVDAAYAMLPHAGPLAQARLCSLIAFYGWIAVDHTSRSATARRAVTLWRGQGNVMELYQALSRYAMQCGRMSEFAEADDALSEARQLERSTLAPSARKLRAFAEGVVAGMRGDARQYHAHVQEALALSLEAGEERYAAHARSELARAALLAGDVDEALALGHAAIATYDELSQPVFHGVAHVTLCTCFLLAGDLGAARAAAMRALPLLERSEALVFLLDPLALIAALTGDCENASLLMGCAEKWHEEMENPRDLIELRLCEQAVTSIEPSIDRRSFEHLHGVGANLCKAQAVSIVRACLEPSTAVTHWGLSRKAQEVIR